MLPIIILLTFFLCACANSALRWLQIEDMRCQLNVTLLKAVLQIHEVVALVDQQLPHERTGSQVVDAAMAEVELLENLRWKQNQVAALINALSFFFLCSRNPRGKEEKNTSISSKS